MGHRSAWKRPSPENALTVTSKTCDELLDEERHVAARADSRPSRTRPGGRQRRPRRRAALALAVGRLDDAGNSRRRVRRPPPRRGRRARGTAAAGRRLEEPLALYLPKSRQARSRGRADARARAGRRPSRRRRRSPSRRDHAVGTGEATRPSTASSSSIDTTARSSARRKPGGRVVVRGDDSKAPRTGRPRAAQYAGPAPRTRIVAILRGGARPAPRL